MSDAEALRVVTDDPAVTGAVHFLPPRFTLADAEALIGSHDDGNCFLGVWLEDRLIGVVGTHAHGSDRLEIGYWIGSRFQRRGYATEAVSTVIGRLRQMHPTRRMTAECKLDNEGSWNLLHKLGFRPTGRKGERPGRELLTIPQR